MQNLLREDLYPLKLCIEELLEFVQGLHMEEQPYFCRFIENMHNNLEICGLVHYEGWEQMEKILRRDWTAANHMLVGIPGFQIKEESVKRKRELDCRFLELISRIEYYMD